MILLLDGNNMAFISFMAMKKAPVHVRKTSVIIGMLRYLSEFIERFEPTGLVVCWDSRSKIRREIYPEYKGNRGGVMSEAERNEYVRQLGICNKLFPLMGIQQSLTDGWEADDAIAWFALNLKARMMIVSGDRDMMQLLNPKVTIYDPRKRIIVDETVWAKLGLRDAHEFLLCKMLSGDKSDNIPGFPGIAEKRAAAWLHKHGEQAIKVILQGKYRADHSWEEAFRIEDRRKIIKRNHALMSLADGVVCDGKPVTKPGEYRKQELWDFLKSNGLKSLATYAIEFKNFAATLKTVKVKVAKDNA